jgi:hypothetical protein
MNHREHGGHGGFRERLEKVAQRAGIFWEQHTNGVRRAGHPEAVPKAFVPARGESEVYSVPSVLSVVYP